MDMISIDRMLRKKDDIIFKEISDDHSVCKVEANFRGAVVFINVSHRLWKRLTLELAKARRAYSRSIVVAV